MEQDEGNYGILKLTLAATLAGITLGKDGLIKLRFEIPQIEMASAMRTILFIDKYALAGVSFEDTRASEQAGRTIKKTIKLGIVKFDGIVFKAKGESILRLESDANSLTVDWAGLELLREKNMNLTLVQKLQNPLDEDEEE